MHCHNMEGSVEYKKNSAYMKNTCILNMNTREKLAHMNFVTSLSDQTRLNITSITGNNYYPETTELYKK